ncbi:MAG: efflux RND transporter periplasmic adaptor subunit [Planctomycetota bacterium]
MRGRPGSRTIFAAIPGLMVLACFGCGPAAAPPAAAVIPEVTVASPATAQLREYLFFTGRAVPAERVEIRARVSGHLTKVLFQPGREVAAGDLLAEIDPRPFQADLDRAKSQLAEAQARAARTDGTFQRLAAAREKGAASEEEFQRALGDRNEAAAAVELARAAESLATLNLEYSTIRSPLAGVAGDRQVDAGNLISGGVQGASLLTTVVAVDPILVAFEMDELTLQKLQESIRAGRLTLQPGGLAVPVQIGLPIHNGDYPLEGLLKFVNNTVDPKTGTILMKAECPNPKPEAGARQLTPGMFVRIRIAVGEAYDAMLIPESALGSDQGTRYLFVVGEDGKVSRLNVEPGLQRGEQREIRAVWQPGKSDRRALTSADRVIVRGLQRVRSGVEVTVSE